MGCLMAKLDKLIQELCPDGVEYKVLEEVLRYEQPSKYIVSNTDYNDEFEIPVLTAGQSFILGYTNEAEGIYEASKNAPVIIFDDFTTANKWVDFRFKVKSSAMKLLTSKDFNKYNIRYLYHVIQTIRYTPVDHSRQWIGTYSKFTIPVPPIEVQEEIVRILDNFTELTAELTAELAARKKQYAYYEFKTIFENNYKFVKLGEICTVNQGLQIPISKRHKTPAQNRYLYITVQFLKNREDEQYYIENPDKNVICSKDDILVTRTGSTGIIITGQEGCFHNNFFKVNCNHLVNKKYMLCLLRSQHMYNKMLAVASGGTVPDLPHKKFYNIEVPLPPLEEQQRIVSILDRFDALCNDITVGLPAEIEARKKQYEYYRDKLLTFKEKVAS